MWLRDFWRASLWDAGMLHGAAPLVASHSSVAASAVTWQLLPLQSLTVSLPLSLCYVSLNHFCLSPPQCLSFIRSFFLHYLTHSLTHSHLNAPGCPCSFLCGSVAGSTKGPDLLFFKADYICWHFAWYFISVPCSPFVGCGAAERLCSCAAWAVPGEIIRFR